MNSNIHVYKPQELRRRGGAYVIAKPFHLEELVRVLRLLAPGAPADPLCSRFAERTVP